MKKTILTLLFTLTAIFLFSQIGSITVISPNGGEYWNSGNTYPITWTSTNLTGNVYIQLLSTLSTQPALTIASNIPIANGMYSWSIPATINPGVSYKIRIVWISILGVYIADESDAPFTIATSYVTPSITVISPNGGESWQIGQTYPITWSYTNLTGTVRIDLISPLMNPLPTQIAEVPIEYGVYNWTIPNSFMPASFYQIVITWVSDLTVYFGDLSDAPFSVIPGGPVPSITVLEPNGGEIWLRGQTRQIRWSSVNPSTAGNVDIALFNRNSTAATPYIITPGTPDTGVYNWTIPNNIIPSRFYKIRIRLLNYNGTSDFSDRYFAILGFPSISIISIKKSGGKVSFNITRENTEPVSVSIYNIKGQLIRNLVSDEVKTGSKVVHWDGLNEFGYQVKEGIYLINLHSGKVNITKKFLLK